ncbi:MAG: caspase family protein [Bacteroidales bacterium]|nr:caspase family protein [Bacteroidales bacterium]
MMKKTGYSTRVFVLVMIAMIWGYSYSFSQEVESNKVRILINNLPDTQPPTIKLMTPDISGDMVYRTAAEEIDLIGEVNDESGVKFVSVNSDIRTINETGIFSSRLKLSPGENKVRLVAVDNIDNLQEQFVTIEYIPPVVTLADRILEEAKYYALIIGIDKYSDPSLHNLENPIKDAKRIYNTLISQYTFHSSDIILLTNAKRNDIVYALDDLASKVTPNDNVLIFYAGHGTWDEKANVGYWLPTNANLTSTANWFRNSTLVDYLKTIDSKHTLLITDACFAGSIFKTRSGFPKQDRAYEVLYELSSRKAMTSGTLTEVPDRSSFTRYLLERLIENEDAYLSSEQLFSSFRIAVINNSDAIPQYGEIRNVGDEGGDFIFLKKK